jgi:carboxypeptidase A, invertebrate
MPKSAFGWDAYYPLESIIGWFDGLVAANPSIMSSQKYGESFEGRDLLAYRISYKAGNPAVFLEAQMHAREWISIASVSWMVNQLLTSSDPEIRDIAENFDWIIIPVANPDGYVFTWTNDRLWRKTRSRQGVTGLCVGTDPNRNWGFNWMRKFENLTKCFQN